MIKTAAIFPDQSARNSGPVLEAVRQSFERAGIAVQINGLDADAVVIWSVLWAGKMAPNRKIYDHYRARGSKIIVVDVGSIIRGVTWKIALDNINASGWFGAGDLDPDRPARLGMIRPITRSGPDILIAAQHRTSLQASAINSMEAWVRYSIDQARQYSDRPIVVRPHPRDRLRLGDLPRSVTVQMPRHLSGTYDTFDWTNDWHAVINHNSGPGVLAGIAGVRPVVDRSSLAWPVAVNMQDIEQPYERDRDQWLIDISHTEYTIDEITQGTWLKRLGSKL